MFIYALPPLLHGALREQKELSPIAMSLRPRGMADDELIPYMALEVI